jgi:predicted metalloprotease with PDZ domain
VGFGAAKAGMRAGMEIVAINDIACGKRYSTFLSKNFSFALMLQQKIMPSV